MKRRKALVITVGTGTRADSNIVLPLEKSFRNSHPDYAVFLFSNESEANAKKIAEDLNLVRGEDYYPVRLTDPDDLQRCFSEINNAFHDLFRKGYRNDDISVDFTSGTKAMTSALVLAGVGIDCSTLKYITGDRENGIVVPGTESFTSFEPNKLKAFGNLKLAQTLIKELRFDTAKDLLKNTGPKLLDESGRNKREALKGIATAYGYWDRFDHKRFGGEMEKVKTFGDPDLACFLPSEETKETLQKIRDDIKKERLTYEVMADITCNARRRMDEGKFDDALARIYRLTEMLAQMVLKDDYGIDSSNVDLSHVPSGLHGKLQGNKSDDGKIQIGLLKDYEILKAKGDKLGELFMENKPFRDLLKKRNRTIFAHGLFPVSEKECRDIFKHFWTLITNRYPGFTNLCDLLTFPWRRT